MNPGKLDPGKAAFERRRPSQGDGLKTIARCKAAILRP